MLGLVATSKSKSLSPKVSEAVQAAVDAVRELQRKRATLTADCNKLDERETALIAEAAAVEREVPAVRPADQAAELVVAEQHARRRLEIVDDQQRQVVEQRHRVERELEHLREDIRWARIKCWEAIAEQLSGEFPRDLIDRLEALHGAYDAFVPNISVGSVLERVFALPRWTHEHRDQVRGQLVEKLGIADVFE